MSNNSDEDETDWTEWSLDVAGAHINRRGKYACDDCGDVLEPTGERKETEGPTTIFWECPSCKNRYPISGADARPQRP